MQRQVSMQAVIVVMLAGKPLPRTTITLYV